MFPVTVLPPEVDQPGLPLRKRSVAEIVPPPVAIVPAASLESTMTDAFVIATEAPPLELNELGSIGSRTMMPLANDDHCPRATARALAESVLEPQIPLKPRFCLDSMITSA